MPLEKSMDGLRLRVQSLEQNLHEQRQHQRQQEQRLLHELAIARARSEATLAFARDGQTPWKKAMVIGQNIQGLTMAEHLAMFMVAGVWVWTVVLWWAAPPRQ